MLAALPFALAFAVHAAWLGRALRGVAFWRAALIVLGPLAAAAVAGRLGHAMVDARTDGNMYFAALLGQVLATAACVRMVDERREPVWRAMILAAPLVYACMRLACLANGCCAGTPADLPWAIVYTGAHSRTPLLGLPLHPVPIYAVLHGLLAGGVLWTMRRRPLIELAATACALLGGGRLVTDAFRADAATLGGAVNHAISLALCTGGLVMFTPWTRRLAIASFLIACDVRPSAPAVAPQIEEGIEIHRFGSLPRGLVIAIADRALDEKLSGLLARVYPAPAPRFDDVAFWHVAPALAASYGTVIRVSAAALDLATLRRAIAMAEAQGDYDLALITHGFDNHLLTRPGTAIAWRDVQALSAPHLGSVFMQACVGASLAQDWLGAGAKSVIAFSDLTDNVAFYDHFVRALAAAKGNVGEAFAAASEASASDLRLSIYHYWRGGVWKRRFSTPEIYWRS
ncbi:MAG: prolipoprotein diacylglyceryl transferase [Deltaproteobacteria bacterium]|nr:prolipoprotein diacylglyceryl transferase [Deltaproteobacteria bacterium]